MHRFFAEPGQIQGDRIVLTGRDVNHIKNVLRMKPGEEFAVSAGGMDYRCVVETISPQSVEAQIRWSQPQDLELPCKITLFQGLPKADKMDLIVQKTVELGITSIIPVNTKRVVVRLDEKKEASRLKRWREIAKSAAGQAGRGLVPEVEGVLSFPEALTRASQMDKILIPYEKAEGMEETRQQIRSLEPGNTVGIFIGPEGGFAEEEVQDAVEAGAAPITLGKRILRTETAGMALLSMLILVLETD